MRGSGPEDRSGLGRGGHAPASSLEGAATAVKARSPCITAHAVDECSRVRKPARAVHSRTPAPPGCPQPRRSARTTARRPGCGPAPEARPWPRRRRAWTSRERPRRCWHASGAACGASGTAGCGPLRRPVDPRRPRLAPATGVRSPGGTRTPPRSRSVLPGFRGRGASLIPGEDTELRAQNAAWGVRGEAPSKGAGRESRLPPTGGVSAGVGPSHGATNPRPVRAPKRSTGPRTARAGHGNVYLVACGSLSAT